MAEVTAAFRRRGDPPLAESEILEQIGRPLVLAPGHPLRGDRCLLCAALVGGREVVTATLIDARRKNCSCGAVPTLTYLICAGHDLGTGSSWAETALERWNGHHVTTMGRPA